MFEFVYWLKAIAVGLITNSHYAEIWPVSAMAMGGHLGNNLFFLLSGFCLCNIKESFPKWYVKRILRIYPALWIANTINLIFGFFHASGLMAYVHCYIYPTWYHFVKSIMLLYILFYLVRFLQSKFKIDTALIIIVVLLVFSSAYFIWYDKSYYHIDDILENWVRFMFFESMLIGAYLRQNYDKFKSGVSMRDIVCCSALLIGHVVSKLILRKIPAAASIQIISPLIIISCVAYITAIFIKLEKKGVWKQYQRKYGKVVRIISGMSLEVYLCQYLFIHRFYILPFPVNFLVVTGFIILTAQLIHIISDFINKHCRTLLHL